MDDLKNNISIFLSESIIFIAVYVTFSLVVCSTFLVLELYNQSTDVSMIPIAIKAIILLVFSALYFTLSLYLVGWHSSLLGGELITNVVLAVIWFYLLYSLNNYLIAWCGLSFENMKYYIYYPVYILMSPFIIFNIFLVMLKNVWDH